MKYATEQVLEFFVFDSNDAGVEGQQNNITCTLSKDGGTAVALTNQAITGYTQIGDGRYSILVTVAETTCHQMSLRPVCAGYQIYALPSPLIYTSLEDAIKARTDLIIYPSAVTGGNGPVNADGTLTTPLVIGDDYLTAQDRGFQFIITDPGMVAATSTCKLGFNSATKGSFEVSGAITDNGSTWTLDFDVTAADSASLLPGLYDWSSHVADASTNKQTRIRSTTTSVYWVTAQTTV